MAIQHHPLSNAALGEYLKCEHVEEKSGALTTYHSIFYYWLGEVKLDKNWKYHTEIYPVVVLDSMSQMSEANSGCTASIDVPYINPAIMDFLEENTEQSSVAPQLDKASIDGMDDMAFGCKICGNAHELGINKEGICFGCNYEGDNNPLDNRSAADETSINHLKSDCIDLIEDTNIQASYRIESEGEQ